MSASGSYVFKLHYNDGPSHVSRRYGYTGKINLPAVYTGLFDRTAQVLGLPSGSFTLALLDPLGRPSIKLDTFHHFLAHVCTPLIANPDSVKIDEKGRRVLVFIVEKKGVPKNESGGQAPLTCSAPPPLPLHLPQSARESTLADSSVDDLSKRIEPIKPTVRQPVGVSGYHAAYSSPTASSSTTPASPSTSGSVPVEAKKEPKETWGTVRNMLETFVKDLNVHLADTFGDEAGSFRLNASEKENDKTPLAKPVEEPQVQKPLQPKPIFTHVFCDRCLKTIAGSRFKCKGCSNYDLCESCIDFRTQFHPGAHAFSEIAYPGADAVPSARGAVEVEARPSPPSLAPLSIPVATAPSVRPITHNATCDGCQNTIVGTRKKCVECPDYDLCSVCHEHAAETIHPGHSFVSLHSPRDLEFHSRASSIPVHHHVRCDSCNKSPIRGVRYKCTHVDCPDYDLCGNCEADPIARHPLDHHLLKIRQPRSTLFGISNLSGGGVPEAVRRAHEISQRFVGSGRGGCGQVPAQHANPIANLLSTIGAAVQNHVAPNVSMYQPVPTASTTEKAETSTVGTQVDDEMREVKKEVVVEEEDKIESESEDESEVEEKKTVVEAEKRLGCAFVADVTLEDGSVVPAGSEFCKVWRVRNTGTLPWKSARLVNVGGFEARQEKGFEVADLEPGEETEVKCECKAPEEDGRFMSFFRLEDAEGNKFGDRIWLDITVESEGTLRSSESLSSSSIIAPSLTVGGKAASIPATTTSAAPSTTFSLSEVESDFESVARSGSHFSSRAHSEIVVGSEGEDEDEEDDMSSSSSEESSELESDSDDEFVVLSDEADGWRRE
ncbi:hypothetical protein JCM16303_000290 [Sporobolomyces ruberrimus]